MIDTILFDLDGTLLPMDTDKFIENYFNELSIFLKDHIHPELLISAMWTSLKTMIKNKDYIPNSEIFTNTFCQLVSLDKNKFEKLFNDFYDNDFLKIKKFTSESPIMKECVKILKSKGYTLAIATNPIFPLKSNLHRIKWAGLDLNDFIYCSYLEKNHYCKPNIEYYQEMLADIKKSPEQCIMIGNDVQEDLVASNIGIKTFLITDYIINRKNAEIICDYKGTYEDFYNFVANHGDGSLDSLANM